MEGKSMSDLADIFESLYSHFLLRDIVAKVIPGLLSVMIPLVICANDLEPVKELLKSLNLIALFVLIYGVGLAIGMILQQLGMLIPLIKIHVWKSDSNDSDNSIARSTDAEVRFLKIAIQNRAMLRRRERLIILKEMCGNYAMAMLIILTTFLIRFLMNYQSWSLRELAIILSIGFVIYLLIRQNYYLAREQHDFESLVINGRIVN
jgi:hypothetical protein